MLYEEMRNFSFTEFADIFDELRTYKLAVTWSKYKQVLLSQPSKIRHFLGGKRKRISVGLDRLTSRRNSFDSAQSSAADVGSTT